MELSPKRRLSEMLFEQTVGQPLPHWIAERRPDESWRSLAAEVYALTDGEVSLTDVTLINWYSEAQEKDPAA